MAKKQYDRNQKILKKNNFWLRYICSKISIRLMFCPRFPAFCLVGEMASFGTHRPFLRPIRLGRLSSVLYDCYLTMPATNFTLRDAPEVMYGPSHHARNQHFRVRLTSILKCAPKRPTIFCALPRQRENGLKKFFR